VVEGVGGKLGDEVGGVWGDCGHAGSVAVGGRTVQGYFPIGGELGGAGGWRGAGVELVVGPAA
jgi:hypothetical protein